MINQSAQIKRKMADVSFCSSPLWQGKFCPAQTQGCLNIYSLFAVHIKLHINSDCKRPKTRQTKDSVQKLFPRGNLFPGAFSQVKIFGYWNCQGNAQIVKKSYKHTLNERKNSTLLQSRPLPKVWFTNQRWQVTYGKRTQRTLLIWQTRCHGHHYPLWPLKTTDLLIAPSTSAAHNIILNPEIWEFVKVG